MGEGRASFSELRGQSQNLTQYTKNTQIEYGKTSVDHTQTAPNGGTISYSEDGLYMSVTTTD